MEEKWEQQYTIQNMYGFHIRPSAAFAKTASQFQCEVKVSYDGRSVNGKSVISLLTLGVGHGEQITIITKGPDAKPALQTLGMLVDRHFELEEERVPPRTQYQPQNNSLNDGR